ncbi:MAG: hypothetical protein JSU68_14470 [Phycisphaerales bacterium]|nr:MAG: hypothetical protein JSU68_14470 [Phycisphaerales bacterium]
MAIQFACSSCTRLIEVDDELAGQWAMCPYCQSTVQVPDKTTLTSEAAAPAEPGTASQPVIRSPGPQPTTVQPTEPVLPYHGSPPPPRTGNAFGNWGLAISLLSWGTILVMLGWLFVEVASSPAFEDAAEPTPEEVQQVILEIMKDPERGRVPALFGLAAMFFALVAVVLSVIGLTRPNKRKGTAIAGVIIGGTLLACQCVGTFGGMGSI